MNNMKTDTDFDVVLQELEKSEQIESLSYLVKKLPEFTAAIQSIEDKLSFVTNTLNDKQALNSLVNEAEEKVERLHLNKDHLEAMVTLVQFLPKLVPLTNKMEEFTIFITNILGDSKSVDYLIRGIDDVMPIQKGIEIMKETNKRYQENKDTSNISILRLYRLLKDPTIQKGFKYFESLLEVINMKVK
ncbi:hypothetical protein ACQKP0_01860 [Heyndrickxia sp. NPDC080065]|uniref:hypothetical protein n=1 Tax=Heyndrickxia sp. NPDC080065 TaxID=3390568 RepID=UPI003D024E67